MPNLGVQAMPRLLANRVAREVWVFESRGLLTRHSTIGIVFVSDKAVTGRARQARPECVEGSTREPEGIPPVLRTVIPAI